MINIIEVTNKKLAKKFVDFPIELYKDCPYYVPELRSDAINAVYKNTCYKDQTKTLCILAYQNNKIVGRLQGIIQLAANQKWNQKRIRFTRFDSINNQDVANALFDYVASWGKLQGMTEIVGPLGYSDFEREGLLVEGFDQLSTYEECYNYEYYKTLIENYGFVKEVGWEERKLKLNKDNKARFERLSQQILKRYDLHFATFKNVNEFIDKYADSFFDIVDDTYDKIYGTIPFSKLARKSLAKNMKLIVSVDKVGMVLDNEDKPVAFGICFPSISKSVNKCKGRLFPFGFINVLKEIKHPEVIDLGLVGIVDKYKNSGVISCILTNVMTMLEDECIDHAETNLNLEDNTAIISMWKYFDSTLHKKRIAYKKDI